MNSRSLLFALPLAAVLATTAALAQTAPEESPRAKTLFYDVSTAKSVLPDASGTAEVIGLRYQFLLLRPRAGRGHRL